MANSEHVKIVLDGAAEVSRWRRSHPSEVLDLRAEEWSGSVFNGCDLGKANFGGSRFSRAEFIRCSLIGADFRHCSVDHSVFSGSDLSECDFSDAEFSACHFDGCRFERSLFRRTVIRASDLTEALIVDCYIYRTDLTDCSFGGTTLVGVDLREVSGLGTLYHAGVSYLGCDVLLRCIESVPDGLLAACGVPRHVKEALMNVCGNRSKYYSCFISYAHHDEAFVVYLVKRLNSAGVLCWVDRRNAKDGHEILPQIHEGINRSDKVILVCSEASLSGSWWVNMEIGMAAEKECLGFGRGGGGTMLPIDLDGYVLSWNSAWRSWLCRVKVGCWKEWARGGPQIEAAFSSLLDALRVDRGE